MYGGEITGTGPRYCPSIEDKVVRFSDKPRHQIFVEPVGLDTDEMYIQGMSSSLPEDVQILRGYSDAAQWNDLLSLWETHPAIDFAQPAAHALMHGTISECGMHPVYGGYIRINSGEFEILYASLLPDPALSAGMQVRAGDYLGIPDSSMPSERYMGSHLHIEVTHSGKLQNLYTLQAESNLMD